MLSPTEKTRQTQIIVNKTADMLSCIIGERIRIKVIYKERLISVEMIKQMISSHFKITWDEIIDKALKQKHAKPRMIFCYLTRKYCGYLTLNGIGSYVNISHGAVVKAVQRTEGLMFVKDDYIIDDITPMLELIHRKMGNSTKD